MESRLGYRLNKIADMKFLRENKRRIMRDQIRKEDIRAQLNMFSMSDRIYENSLRWRQHFERIKKNRLVK